MKRTEFINSASRAKLNAVEIIKDPSEPMPTIDNYRTKEGYIDLEQITTKRAKYIRRFQIDFLIKS